MTAFPDIIGDDLTIEPRFTVQEQALGEVHFARYRKSIRPRYAFTLGWSMLSPTEARSVSDLVLAQSGNALPFDWFMWNSLHWIWVPLGIGNGATTVWTIPGKSTSEHEFFTGVSTAVSGTVTAGNGVDGADTVTISPAAANGVVVWANFRGRRRFRCVFELNDQPMPRIAETGYYSFTTRLMEVK